jgi:hypothetical protein
VHQPETGAQVRVVGPESGQQGNGVQGDLGGQLRLADRFLVLLGVPRRARDRLRVVCLVRRCQPTVGRHRQQLRRRLERKVRLGQVVGLGQQYQRLASLVAPGGGPAVPDQPG